jgi:hypothetical protein
MSDAGSSIPGALIGAALVTLLAGAPPAAASAGFTAEVRTWTGQSWRLTQASLERAYTVVVMKAEEAPPSAAPRTELTVSFGTTQTKGAEKKPLVTMQGQQPAEWVTLFRAGMEIRVPLASLARLAFARTPVPPSRLLLPPYLAPSHFRVSATALLTDGSRIEADYVNLGATALRGITPEGRVDIPWEEIEVLRFVR